MVGVRVRYGRVDRLTYRTCSVRPPAVRPSALGSGLPRTPRACRVRSRAARVRVDRPLPIGHPGWERDRRFE